MTGGSYLLLGFAILTFCFVALDAKNTEIVDIAKDGTIIQGDKEINDAKNTEIVDIAKDGTIIQDDTAINDEEDMLAEIDFIDQSEMKDKKVDSKTSEKESCVTCPIKCQRKEICLPKGGFCMKTSKTCIGTVAYSAGDVLVIGSKCFKVRSRCIGEEKNCSYKDDCSRDGENCCE